MNDFQKSQSSKILSCYQTTDILQKGKKAEIGEIRVWGGVKHVKLPNGLWGIFKEGSKNNKVIHQNRSVINDKHDLYKDEKKFTTDQVILSEISKLSPKDKKEKLDLLDKHIDHLKKKIEIMENVQESGSNVEGQSAINSYQSKVDQLEAKKSEIEHGHLLKEELEKKVQEAKESKNKKDLNTFQHVHNRKFKEHDADTVRRNQYLDSSSKDIPWTEEMWDEEPDSSEIDKFKEHTYSKAKMDFEDKFNKTFKSAFELSTIINKKYISPDDKISVTFTDGQKAERTFGQLKEYVQREVDKKTKGQLPISNIKFKHFAHLPKQRTNI